MMLESIWQSKQEDPYVNLCLGILNQARMDYGVKYRRDGEKSMGNNCPDGFWHYFRESSCYTFGMREADPMEIAQWVAHYICA